MQRARREKCQAYCGHEKRGKPNALTVLVLQLILLGTITHLRVFGGCFKIVESIGVCSASGFIPAGPVWLALLFFGGGGGRCGGVRCGHRPRLDSKLVFVLPFTLPTPAVTLRDNRGEEGVLSEWKK